LNHSLAKPRLAAARRAALIARAACRSGGGVAWRQSTGAQAMTEHDPQAGPSTLPEATTPPAVPPARRSFWLRELPFTIVLILTIAGVAYTTFSKQPIALYWEILAPIIGLVCVGAGWQEAGDKTGRMRLIVTQALHWGAFLLVMNILLLGSVQRIFTAQTTALAIFTLLALGTFTAGVQVLSWQVCLLGVIMALGVPAVAWIENSALLVTLVVASLIGLAVVLWWHLRGSRAPAT
jgi:hypothetical protein